MSSHLVILHEKWSRRNKGDHGKTCPFGCDITKQGIGTFLFYESKSFKIGIGLMTMVM